jgi:hypothetical protein
MQSIEDFVTKVADLTDVSELTWIIRPDISSNSIDYIGGKGNETSIIISYNRTTNIIKLKEYGYDKEEYEFIPNSSCRVLNDDYELMGELISNIRTHNIINTFKDYTNVV